MSTTQPTTAIEYYPHGLVIREYNGQLIAEWRREYNIREDEDTIIYPSPDMSAVDIRKWIRAHINECPYPIRLEDDKSAPTWVHIDVCNVTDKKLIEFSA